jgi:hypothetical protein
LINRPSDLSVYHFNAGPTETHFDTPEKGRTKAKASNQTRRCFASDVETRFSAGPKSFDNRGGKESIRSDRLCQALTISIYQYASKVSGENETHRVHGVPCQADRKC